MEKRRRCEEKMNKAEEWLEWWEVSRGRMLVPNMNNGEEAEMYICETVSCVFDQGGDCLHQGTQRKIEVFEALCIDGHKSTKMPSLHLKRWKERD